MPRTPPPLGQGWSGALTRIALHIETDPSGCTLWTGPLRNGYGFIKIEGRNLYIHRLVWELTVGPIPEGFTVDHRCHNEDESCPGGIPCRHRPCCNVDHLEPVTNRVNFLRGKHPWAVQHRLGICQRGHPLPEQGQCRECARINEGYQGYVANRDKTHCKNGHEFTPENTYWRPNRQGRDCRICIRERLARSERKRST